MYYFKHGLLKLKQKKYNLLDIIFSGVYNQIEKFFKTVEEKS